MPISFNWLKKNLEKGDGKVVNPIEDDDDGDDAILRDLHRQSQQSTDDTPIGESEAAATHETSGNGSGTAGVFSGCQFLVLAEGVPGVELAEMIIAGGGQLLPKSTTSITPDLWIVVDDSKAFPDSVPTNLQSNSSSRFVQSAFVEESVVSGYLLDVDDYTIVQPSSSQTRVDVTMSQPTEAGVSQQSADDFVSAQESKLLDNGAEFVDAREEPSKAGSPSALPPAAPVQPPQNMRSKYQPDEDRQLVLRVIQSVINDGEKCRGRRLYQKLVPDFPNRTVESLRCRFTDHLLKRLLDSGINAFGLTFSDFGFVDDESFVSRVKFDSQRRDIVVLPGVSSQTSSSINGGGNVEGEEVNTPIANAVADCSLGQDPDFSRNVNTLAHKTDADLKSVQIALFRAGGNWSSARAQLSKGLAETRELYFNDRDDSIIRVHMQEGNGESLGLKPSQYRREFEEEDFELADDDELGSQYETYNQMVEVRGLEAVQKRERFLREIDREMDLRMLYQALIEKGFSRADAGRYTTSLLSES